MALDIGTRIGHYEITGRLGAGGMGEVYRAHDGKLRRDVAVKVLPDGFAEQPERLARFEREAQLLASLNHPNVGGIYGLEEVAGNRCLILELVEGETLAELIAKGPLPLERAVGLALQIAEALETAHDKGIVHRDLKPANVKVTPEGTVKVLDFGLAKAFADDGGEAGSDSGHSPTLTMAATQAGMILGTAAYMSPEQAAGQAADRRSDIWSFGVVLLEMLTGRQFFSGETVSHTLAAVLKDEPDWESLPGDVPPRLRELLESCLRKKRRERLQAIGDARIVLEAWLADPGSFVMQAPAGSVSPAAVRPSRTPWIVAGVLAAALVAAVTLLWPEPAPPSPPVRTSVVLPAGQTLFRGYGSSLILSPDGATLAYVAQIPQLGRGLYVRGLDQWTGIELTREGPPYHPFFSPDGDWIGFVDRVAMYKVPVRGGSPIKLTDVALNRGASWGEDGFIVFASSPNSGLSRIPAAGGVAEALTEVGEGESHRWPQVLPGAKVVLFTSAGSRRTSFDQARIEALVLDSGERRVIHEGGTYARYAASGHLVFASGSALFAAPFDPEKLEMTGGIVPVLDELSTAPSQGGAQFDVSTSGRLVYAVGDGGDRGYRMVRVERSGARTPIADEWRTFMNPEPSPDYERLAVDIAVEGKTDVWVYDLERGLPTRITSGEGSQFGSRWSPDGQWLYYGAADAGSYRIERIAADGSGEPEVVIAGGIGTEPLAISPDGRRMIYRDQSIGDPNLRSVSIEGGESEPFVETPGIDYDARFSPDGRWIAYGTNEPGQFEIFVVPAAGGRGRWQISNGGVYPRWSDDGKTIFYRDLNGALTEVSIDAGGGSIRAGRPRVVIDGAPYLFINGAENDYAVFESGRSFVMMEKPQDVGDDHEHVSLVLDWFDELRSATGGR